MSLKMGYGWNMYSNNRTMTPLRVKQSIESRFVKVSERELNVLIDGKWVGFVNLPPHVDCSELLTMYLRDKTLIESPVINATNCTSLREVFRDCTNLKTLGYIHCPNVTDMYAMLRGCSSLTTIPQLDTSNVTTMDYMLYGCSSLTTIPQLDTSNVTSMNYMLYGCSSLTTIPQLDTSNVARMDSTFRGCSSLTTIPQLDTSNVANMDYMLERCSSLTTIPQLDTSNVTRMNYMFRGCSVLTSVTFQCTNVRSYGTNMFYGTPIASGNGYIFVPDELVQAYRTAEGWSTHASVIFGHSDKENMTSAVEQMTVMNIENKPSEEELQLMMQEFDDEELM